MTDTNEIRVTSVPGFQHKADANATKLPDPLVGIIIAICVLPFLLNLFGAHFDTQGEPFPWSAVSGMTAVEQIDRMYYALEGSFWHTILEWSAFCTAIFTVILAFAHYNIKREIVVPIIGVALFCSGTMDSFHTLAADRLIESVADNRNLVPFTWAIIRVFNAVILLGGTGLLLLRGVRTRKEGQEEKGWGFILMVCFVFGVSAYVVIHLCATSTRLPQTMFPDSLITRPWDVVPLILFIGSGILVFPRFYRKYPSLFSHALIVSMAPQVMTQLHMAFGSTALFDNHFNIAHFLKVFAYAVPFSDLMLDYIRTYRAQSTLSERLEHRVDERTRDLETEIAERNRTTEEMIGSVQVLTVSVDEILTAMGQYASAASEISAEVNQTTATMQEIAQIAQESSQRAEEVSASAQQTEEVSQSGQKATADTGMAMDHIRQQMGSVAQTVVDLSDQNQVIGTIIGAVTDLAEQSNLLAVNAAIEAAKAGDYGKGFAVVSQEIKNLAEQSKQATAQVQTLLHTVQSNMAKAAKVTEQSSNAVEEGVRQSERAGEAIRHLAGNVGLSAKASMQIAVSSKEQAIGIEQVLEAMERINQATSQNLDSTKQVEDTVQDLQNLGQRLNQLVERYREEIEV